MTRNEKQDKDHTLRSTDAVVNICDDPRMTAYLLNELDPSEKEAWEQIMNDNPSIQAELAAMKETIDRVRESLQSEPLVPGSVTISSSDTASTLKTGAQAVSFTRCRLFHIFLALTAASVLFAVSFPFTGIGINPGHFGCNSTQRESSVARRHSPFTHGNTAEPAPIATQVHIDMDQSSVSTSAADRNESQSRRDNVEQLPSPSGTKEDSIKDDLRDGLSSGGTVSAKPQAVSAPKSEVVSPRKQSLAMETAKLQASSSPVPATAPVPTALPAVADKGTPVTARGERKPSSGTGIIVGKEIFVMNSIPESRMKSEAGLKEVNKAMDSKSRRAKEKQKSASPRKKPDLQMFVSPSVIIQEEEESPVYGRIVRPEPDRKRDIDFGEGYSAIKENEFVPTKEEVFSTFSIDVDTASYSNVRRFLDMGRLPPASAVKIEELVNYFKYDYAAPKSDAKEPFATRVEVVPCPWEPSHLLARIAVKGKEIPKAKRPPLNLVFLIDVSGSMSTPNKLPLVKRALEELVNQLDQRDRVAIVTYAGSSKVHLKTTQGDKSETILRSIDQLDAGGSTAGADGIRTAYEIAKEQFNTEGVNRVILCTDGDFNVGTTDNKELENMIAQKAKSGVFLSILGFGMGNYKDDRLAKLSNRGNGNYGYIDDIAEARRLLVDGLTGTLVTIAKDVKIQIDFNPARVAAWRLIGYEDRILATEDFNNDRKDAGEIGAGHNVTALYEIVPVGASSPWVKRVDQSRYATDDKKTTDKKDDKAAHQTNATAKKSETKPESAGVSHLASELMFVKLRYKKPDGNKSELLTFPVLFEKDKKAEPTSDFNFAASVALFGMLLRDSQYAGDGSFAMVLSLAGNTNDTSDSARSEYVSLVKKAKRLAGR